MIEKPTHDEPPRQLAGEKSRGFRLGRPLELFIVAAVVLIILLVVISGCIQKGLWMRQLGYSGVFWTLLALRWELFCGAFVVAFLYLWINFRLAAGNGGTIRTISLPSESTGTSPISLQISPMALKLAMAAIAAFAAVNFAALFYAQWDTYLRFRYGGSFGLSDPLFGVMSGFICSVSPFMSFCRSA